MMPDLRPQNGKLWGWRMSGSGKCNTNNSQVDHHYGRGSSRSQSHPNRKERKELLQHAATRLTRRKSEKSGCSQRGASPACLKNRHNQSPKSVGFFCSQSQNRSQRFTPLDDDTFSTRPLIGLTSGCSNHYSEIWLAGYIESATRQEPRRSSSGVVLISQDGGAARGTTQNLTLQEAAAAHNTQKETINGLATPFNNLPVDYDPLLGSRSHRVSEFDATSRTSSIDTSEFSFEADFIQMDNIYFDKHDNAAVTDSENSPAVAAYFAETKSNKSTMREQGVTTSEMNAPLLQARATAGELKDVRIDHTYSEAECQTNLPQQVAKTHLASQRNLESTESMEPRTKVFRPILAESSCEGEMIPYEESTLETTGSLKRTGTDHIRSLTVFRSAGLDGLGDVVDPYIMSNEEQTGLFGGHPEDTKIDEFDIYINIHDSFDQSNFLSEMTETVVSGGALMYPEEERVITRIPSGEAALRKAKCVVVYEKQTNESEPNGGAPSNIREMWVKYEARKRLEADHAEKFGYKDFFPIHEQRKREGNRSVVPSRNEQETQAISSEPFKNDRLSI